MDLGQLIQHPELMDKETLYDLRSLVALYPYYQTARLLMLQNLYILHSPSFDEELRKASLFFADRKVLFQLIESAHYKLRNIEEKNTKKYRHSASESEEENRTISLIDQFLDTIPEEQTETQTHRKPTPADAAIDYVSYLLETESKEEKEEEQQKPHLKGQDLIDNFINNEGGKIELAEAPDSLPQIDDKSEDSEVSEGVFTETLARIYIKQGQYSKALEIIKQLNLNYPKKNVYFADQIRFLEKLIINNKNK